MDWLSIDRYHDFQTMLQRPPNPELSLFRCNYSHLLWDVHEKPFVTSVKKGIKFLYSSTGVEFPSITRPYTHFFPSHFYTTPLGDNIHRIINFFRGPN